MNTQQLQPNNLDKIILYDLSTIIISGIRNKKFRLYNTNAIPTGGLYKLAMFLKRDLESLGPNDCIVLCRDSRNSIRRDAYPDYKANRGSNVDSVDKQLTSMQFQMLEEFLDDFGVTHIMYDGYEADDIIYNIAGQNPNTKIILRADDKDLQAVSVINQNVEMYSPTNKTDKILDHPVYKTTDLILHGDAIDSIKSLRLRDETNKQLEYLMNTHQIPIYLTTVTKEMLYSIGVPEHIIEPLYKNIFLAAHKIFPFYIPLKPSRMNEEGWLEFLSTFRMKRLCKSMLKKEIDINIPRVIELNTMFQYQVTDEIRALMQPDMYKDEYQIPTNTKIDWVV